MISLENVVCVDVYAPKWGVGECGRVKKCGGLTCSQQLKMLTILVLDTYKSKPVYLAQKKDDKDVLCETGVC